MTPSNQHSAEQLAQAFHENYERLAPQFNYSTRVASAVPWADVPEINKALMIATAEAVLAGRESKQHTDRETLIGILEDQGVNSYDGADPERVADAILAYPSLSLVAARRDFAEKASAHMRANGHGFTRRIDMELLYDALFASGTLKPSSDYLVWVSEDGSRHDHPVAGSGHWVHESRSEVEAAALEAFKDRLLAAVGPVVMHANGSGGVFEFSPKGTPTEFWGYENAVAVSSAVIEVLGLLGYEFPSTRGTTYAGGRDKPRTLQDAMDEAARVRSGKDEA